MFTVGNLEGTYKIQIREIIVIISIPRHFADLMSKIHVFAAKLLNTVSLTKYYHICVALLDITRSITMLFFVPFLL